ncbi:MAG: response regulator [Betaproteobacteria bacterium]
MGGNGVYTKIYRLQDHTRHAGIFISGAADLAPPNVLSFAAYPYGLQWLILPPTERDPSSIRANGENLLPAKQLTIVIADDDSHLREALRVLLRHDEYDVVGDAANGVAALEACQKLKPDVMLVDINMPLKDGLTVLDELNASKYTGVVVLISSEATLDRVQTAIKKGAAGFIVKPFKLGTVLDELRVCLQRKK